MPDKASPVGQQRLQALWRIVALVWAATVGSVLFAIIVVAAVIWGVLDLFMQLVFNSNILSERSRPAFVIINTWKWWAGQWTYAFTGGGPDGRTKLLPNYRLMQR